MSTSVPVAEEPPVVVEEPGASLAGRRSVRTASAQSDAAVFTIGSYVAQFLMFVANLVQRALLGPVGSGYWALMQSFWTYFSVATLGTQQGATRQIPVYRGQNDYATAGRTSDTGASFAVLMIGVLGALLAAVAVVFGGGWAPEIRFGLILLGLTAPLRGLMDAQEGIIASVKRFDAISAATVVQALGALVLQTLAVWWLGFYGLFLGLVGIQLCTLAIWVKMGLVGWTRPAFRLRIERPRLRELIGYGLPILAYGQVWQLFLGIDSLIVAGALGVRELGYYALALSVTHYVLLLPKSVGATLFPRMAERFGQTGSMESIRHYATDTQRLLAYVLVPISVAGAFCFVPVLIRQALPAFLPAVEVVHVIVGAAFLLALMNMPVKLLITAGYRWSLTGIYLVCLAINAGLTYAAVGPLELGLMGAAGATALSYLVTFLITGAFAYSRTMALGKVVAHLGEILVVGVYCLGALLLIERVVGTGDGLIADVAVATAKFALFMVALTPWLVLAERRLGGLTMLLGLLRQLAGKVRSARG